MYTSNFQICDSRAPRPRFHSASQGTNFVRWFFLSRASSLAVQWAVIRITVEYAFKWNMQREPRHRTNKSVSSDGIYARSDSRVLRLVRIFAKYVIYGTVVAYTRPWLYFVDKITQTVSGNESNVFSFDARIQRTVSRLKSVVKSARSERFVSHNSAHNYASRDTKNR